mmetsp:Transcript_5466/g.7497  ORF Transcript_5466/g.7497 Transcript_5466/m.7497 type:complete len:492 (+) Transcript_5466:100-1575(+)
MEISHEDQVQNINSPENERIALIEAAKNIVKEKNSFFKNEEEEQLREERESYRLAHTVMNMIHAEDIDWSDRQRKDQRVAKEWKLHLARAGRKDPHRIRTPVSHYNRSQPSNQNMITSLLAAKRASKLIANKSKALHDPSLSLKTIPDQPASNAIIQIEKLKKQLRGEPESQNTLALEIGRQYKAIGGIDKAAEFFVLGSRQQEKAKQRSMTTLEEQNEKRKLDRMTKQQRADYLKKKEEEEQSVQRLHRTKQLQAWHVSHKEAFLAFLMLKNPEKALEYMQKWVAIYKKKKSKLEAYKFIDQSLSEYELLKSRDRSFDRAIRQQSLSILDDYHIKVLNILLEAEPSNKEYLKTIGILYTRSQRFDQSSSRFRQYVNLANKDKLKELPEYRHQDYYYIKAKQRGSVSKSIRATSHWQQDNLTDSQLRDARDDFTQPGKNHIGSGTVIYGSPPTGWDHSIFTEYHKMKESLEDISPPILGNYKTDSETIIIN